MAEIIQTEKLTHRYGSFVALHDLTLAVHPGEIFGFLGSNGAGKTTTIRTLLDFIRPSAGSAKIFGLDTRENSVQIRERVGFLPAELALWDNWTGAQYIGWLEGVRKKSFLAEAKTLAARLEYDLERPLKGMSTGMKRKMGLIAALAHKPELLILDEPTSGLDPLMQQVFNELMEETRAEGRTVFLSSHNLTEVRHICDRVGIIRAGELEAVESVSNLLRVAFRWLTLTTEAPAHLDGFERISGVSEVSAEGNKLKMRVSGEADMNAVVQAIATQQIKDLQLEQPTLEEIFLSYYGQKEA
jgi:ABC-2 type transport system ATP-binding protein